VVFAAGKLWAGVNTVITVASKEQVGIAYFIVRPNLEDGLLRARVSTQGYAAVAGNNVMFPSIGVTAKGRALMTFTLLGPSYFPSAAYTPIRHAAGKIRVAAAGLGPEDGFTSYPHLDPVD